MFKIKIGVYMIIKKLILTNFRNYEHESVEFSDKTNLIVGKNAQGKTNLVEPIYLLSTFKSFRNSKLHDCVKEEEKDAVVEAVVSSEIYGERKIKLVIKKDGENEFYVNGNKLSQKKEMLGFVYSVVFSPDELKLVKGGPEIRREFLDIDISQVSKAYCSLLERYEQILTNRNKLLKNYFGVKNLDLQLDIWDEQLALIGSQIALSRKNFIEKINNKINSVMQYISKGKENLEVKYLGLKGIKREEITDKFLESLKTNRQRDKDLGYTSVGPHRDELKFFINNKEVKPFASQGQCRSVVLALKLAELETIKEEKECPVLILDDVFSELDYSRQELLLKYLENQQIFITSTFAKVKNLNNYIKLRVVNGKVKKCKN